jgi:DNA polymerase elongation subunit (family B)
MKVPLLVDIGEDFLTIVYNSTYEVVPPPITPHLWVLSTDTIGEGGLTDRGRKQVRRIPIGHKDPEVFDIVEASTIAEFNKLYISGVPMCKFDYDELVYIEAPDFYYQYPNTDPLRILVLDMEVLTRGLGIFPNATRDPIIAIGYKLVGAADISIALVEDPGSKESEAAAISSFLDHMRELDPDIIATYNGVRFDIRYLLSRMDILGLDTTVLGRAEGIVSPKDIPGRIHWDMWEDVEGDQTLLGLPNRRLKTIAHHFGWSDIIDLGREALSDTSKLVGTPELSEYLSSDVRLTEQLVGVYIDGHIAKAEMSGLPLREMIRAYDTLLPKVFHARNLQDEYIGVYTNQERYGDKLGTMRYESAKVALYDGGTKVEELKRYFPKIYKVDFSSQYPSAMDTFNLSPETTRIMDYRKYTGEFNFTTKGKYLWLNIPDKNAELDIVIRVDMSKDGFLRSELRKLRERRSVLKKLSKENPEDKALYSQQWAIKVFMNAIYGYEGLATSRIGDLSVAMATVGLCRYLIGKVEDQIGNHLIETDSVTGDTLLHIRSRYGLVEELPIESLVPKDSNWKRHSSYTSYRHSVPKDMRVLTREGWCGINYVKQHLVSKRVFRVSTATGYVDVTEDHSLFRHNQTEVKPTELRVHDRIEVLGGSEEVTEIRKIGDRNDLTWVYDISTEDGTFIVANGDICARNTDGIVIDTDPGIDSINTMLSDLIQSTFGIPSHMEVELEEFADGYFYRTKNYILRELDGRVTVKGNTFKSSKHSRVYERAMNEACRYILDHSTATSNVFTEGKHEVIALIKDWSRYELTDFIKHMTLKKDPDAYFNQNCIQVKLANEAKKYLGADIKEGDGVDYIVVRSGEDKDYRIAPRVQSLEEIYLPYYDGEMDNMLDALGFSSNDKTGQLALF